MIIEMNIDQNFIYIQLKKLKKHSKKIKNNKNLKLKKIKIKNKKTF